MELSTTKYLFFMFLWKYGQHMNFLQIKKKKKFQGISDNNKLLLQQFMGNLVIN